MKKIILFAISVYSLSGCTVATFTGKSGIPILINQPNEKVTFIKHVRIKKHRAFNYTHYYDMSAIFNNRINETKPDMVINTTLSVKHNPANFLLNYLTLGFANSRMIVVEGDFVKKDEGKQANK